MPIPAITKILKQFGRVGVPLYVLYPGGAEQPYIFPELLTKNIVLEKLETINRTSRHNKYENTSFCIEFTRRHYSFCCRFASGRRGCARF